MRWLLLLGMAGTLMGCPKEQVSTDPIPKWKTETGRHAVWRDLAQWYIENGMAPAALEMVGRLQTEGVSDPELTLIQGQALMHTGMSEEALHVLETAAHELPRDPRPHQSLGIVYTDLGNVPHAKRAFHTALRLNPDDVATQNNLGFVLLSEGECNEAVKHLEAVMAIDATQARYRNNLAFALVCDGQPKRALTLFRSTGNEADARYNMGLAYERVDNLPSALVQYQHALSADPEHERSNDAMNRISLLSPNPEQGTP